MVNRLPATAQRRAHSCHGQCSSYGRPDVEVALAESELRAVLLGTVTPADLAARGAVKITDDVERLAELLGYLGQPDPDLAVVTP